MTAQRGRAAGRRAPRPAAGGLAPGVYLEDVYPQPGPSLLTGVPAFLGYAGPAPRVPVNEPRPLTVWPQFEALFGPGRAGGFLDYAVRGFFENGGGLCYAVRLDDGAAAADALRAGLAALRDVDAVDLVCAPDIGMLFGLTDPPDLDAVTELQKEVLADCRVTGGRFAVLDAVPTSDTAVVERQRAALASEDGALYHPWVWAQGSDGQHLYLPPCGHVAGVYARGDQQAGPARAPANMTIDGVLDVRVSLSDDAIGALYDRGVNCLRALPGRGIRIWGARTLSADQAWINVGARRVFLTVARWLERFMSDLAFEPNDVRLWVRIMRELTGYLEGLFQRGALSGSTAADAFFVKCDGETNPPDVIGAGQVVTLVGLALSAPAEFIFVRIIHGASGVSVQPDPATA
jgi:phage tail sheath protein FI